MKNIHILPTENSSRLSYSKDGVLELHRLQWRKNTQHIYITSDEEIKEGDFFLHPFNTIHKAGGNLTDKDFKKIILTTDQDLNKDGVWGIEDGFLEWFVKNPDCEFVELRGYAIILPGEWEEDTPEPKQETLEEAKQRIIDSNYMTLNDGDIFEMGAKWQQEQDKNKYSEEDMKLAFETGRNFQLTGENNFNELIEQFKKK